MNGDQRQQHLRQALRRPLQRPDGMFLRASAAGDRQGHEAVLSLFENALVMHVVGRLTAPDRKIPRQGFLDRLRQVEDNPVESVIDS